MTPFERTETTQKLSMKISKCLWQLKLNSQRLTVFKLNLMLSKCLKNQQLILGLMHCNKGVRNWKYNLKKSGSLLDKLNSALLGWENLNSNREMGFLWFLSSWLYPSLGLENYVQFCNHTASCFSMHTTLMCLIKS